MTETKKLETVETKPKKAIPVDSEEPVGSKDLADLVKPKEAPPEVEETPEQKLYNELEQWWLDQAHTEINAVIPKAIEYGGAGRSNDLIAIGRAMKDAGFPVPEFADEQGESEFLAELGIYFYIVGKMGRWGSALRNGQFVSDDTVYDIGIYTRMVQRIRDVGGWVK